MAIPGFIPYLDPINGSNTLKATLTSCTASNPSDTITRISKLSHGLAEGDFVILSSFSTWLNDKFYIENVQANTFDLKDTVRQTTADTGGTVAAYNNKGTATSPWAGMLYTPATTDEVRFMKTGDPVQIGDAVRHSIDQYPNKTFVPTSSTNASPIVVTKTAHGLVNGDWVVMSGHTTNTKANGAWKVANKTDNTFELEGSTGNGTGGASGTVNKISYKVVEFTNDLPIKIIDNCQDHTTWTFTDTAKWAGATSSTNNKAGLNNMKITTLSGNTINTKFAYKQIGGGSNVDLSAFDRLDFVFQASANGSGQLLIKLCSDTAGNDAVDTFTLSSINQTYNNYYSVARDGGGNFGNNIQSIAIYSGATAPNFNSGMYWAGFYASLSTGLTINDLIAPRSTARGGDMWYNIGGYINSKTIAIDGICPHTLTNSYMGHYDFTGGDETGTCSTYYRKPGLIINPASSTTAWGNFIPACICEGGYDTSGNATGESFYQGGLTNGGGNRYYGEFSISTPTTINYINIGYIYDVKNNGAGIVSIKNARFYGCGNYGLNATTGTFDFGTGYKCFLQGDGNGIYISGAGTNITGELFATMMCITRGISGTTASYINSATFKNIIGCGIGLFYDGSIVCTVTDVEKCWYSGSYGASLNSIARGFRIEAGDFSYGAADGIRLETATLYTTFGEITTNYNVGIGFHVRCIGFSVDSLTANYNTTEGLGLNNSNQGVATNNVIKNLVANYNVYGIDVRTANAGVLIYNYSSIGNTTASIFLSGGLVSRICKASISDTNRFGFDTAGNASSRFYIDDVGGYSVIAGDGRVDLVAQQASVYNTAAPARMIKPNTIHTIYAPIYLRVAKVACTANNLVTVTAYLKKSHATNVVGKLICRAGQIAWSDGTADKSVTKASDTNREPLSFTFTPTEDGVVDIEVLAYYVAGTVDTVTVDDLTVTQA